MEEIIHQIKACGIDPNLLFLGVGIVLAIILLVGLFSKLFIGKDSLITGSFYTSITILFVYAAYAVIYAFALPFPPISLPFADINGEMLEFFSFDSGIPAICNEVFSMLLLAFLASIIEYFIPKGKSFPLWLLFRILTIAGVLISYTLVSALISNFISTKIQEYSSMAILSSLLLLLSTGSLHFLVGTAISALGPIIAALFSFFFVSVFGQKLLKSLIITALFAGMVLLLQHFFIAAVPISADVLIAYVPFALVAFIAWRLIGKLM